MKEKHPELTLAMMFNQRANPLYRSIKEMAEKKAAYQSGEAYRRGSEDIIDVDYVEKEEK